MRKIFTPWLFALIQLLPCPVQAQQDFWEPCGGPIYGGVSALALHPDGDLFAGTTSSGVYRSADGGETWGQVLDLGLSFFNQNSVHGIAVNAQGYVFAATGYPTTVYRSTDKGANWVKKPHGSTTAIILCLTVNLQEHLLAGSSKGLYRSFDNGNTWLPADIRLDSLQINDLYLNPAGHVFACTKGGIFRSTDGGNFWDDLNLDVSVHAGAADANGYVFAAAPDSSLYRSADNGDSWELLPWSPGWIGALEFDTDGQILAGSGTGLFVSADYGNTWQPAGLNAQAVGALGLNAGNELLAGTYASGVFISGDHANSWRPARKGLGNTYVNQFAETSDGFLFASTTGTTGGRGYPRLGGPGVYRSEDEGASWINVFSGQHAYSAVHVTDFGAILVQQTYHNSSGAFSELFRSADKGITWEYVEFSGIVNELVNTGAGHVFACASGYNNFPHGATIGGIYKSTDNGFSWNAVFTAVDTASWSSSQHYTLTINAKGDIFAGITNWPDTIRIIRSTDGGLTWMPASKGIQSGNDTDVLSLAADSENRLFAGLSNGLVYRSQNNGESWEVLSLDSGGAGVTDLAVNASDQLFAATPAGVFISTDHGENWDSLNTGLTNPAVNTLFFSKNGRLFAGTQGSGAYRSVEPVSAVKEVPGKTTSGDALGQIYPNPLREYADIPFSIAASGPAKIAVYDITGREALILFEGDFKPGNYEAAFRPGDLPAGVYFYSLITRNQRFTKKLLIVR